MPGKVQRKGDPNMFGGLITKGDNSVLVNGRPIAYPFIPVTPHPPCSPKKPLHCIAVTAPFTQGSKTVLVNGKGVVTNDKDSCLHGRGMIGGSSDVFAK